jgi:hypothetical protein
MENMEEKSVEKWKDIENREENSDLKESLETMKKRYGTYGRNVSWIVKR